MRIAIISDIHANWHALQAAMDDAEEQGIDAIWCLGDVVGYGPAPAQCWEYLAKILELPVGTWIAGNHDWGLIGRLEAHYFEPQISGATSPVGDFSEHAWDALMKQHEVLKFSGDLFESLGNLPVLASPLAGVYMAHGVLYEDNDSDRTTMIGTYATVSEHAPRSLQWINHHLVDLANTKWNDIHRVALREWQNPRLMLVGHTHIARIWQAPHNQQADTTVRWADRTNEVESAMVWFDHLDEQPLFANPGSVGFARDRAGYATYLLMDWKEDKVGLQLRRIAYDARETIKQMTTMGIAQKVIEQLRAAKLEQSS